MLHMGYAYAPLPLVGWKEEVTITAPILLIEVAKVHVEGVYVLAGRGSAFDVARSMGLLSGKRLACKAHNFYNVKLSLKSLHV